MNAGSPWRTTPPMEFPVMVIDSDGTVGVFSDVERLRTAISMTTDKGLKERRFEQLLFVDPRLRTFRIRELRLGKAGLFAFMKPRAIEALEFDETGQKPFADVKSLVYKAVEAHRDSWEAGRDSAELLRDITNATSFDQLVSIFN